MTRVHGALAGALLSSLSACAASPAMAQPPCAPRDDLAARLAEHYAETTVGRGADTNGLTVELFASPAGTWTLLVTTPDGIGCVIAVGEDWRGVAPLPPAKGRAAMGRAAKGNLA